MNDDKSFSFSIGKHIYVSNNPTMALNHKKKYKDIVIFLSNNNDSSLVGTDIYRLNNCAELIDFVKFYKNNKNIFLVED